MWNTCMSAAIFVNTVNRKGKIMSDVLKRIKKISKGDVILYHTGFLCIDCDSVAEGVMLLREIRTEAMKKCLSKKAILYQQRSTENKFDFNYFIKGI